MSNFTFLTANKDYALFAPACMEAENIYFSAPAMCAVACRKALELAVKWVYSADTSIKPPYKDNLQALIHEPSFHDVMDEKTWLKLPFIIKLGNIAVHTGKNISRTDALLALRSLFEFVLWIDYCYGGKYEERIFSEQSIPAEKVVVDVKKIREQENLLSEKNAEIEELRRQLEAIRQKSEQYTAEKEQHKEERVFQAEDLSEFETRKIYIDVDLKGAGWIFAAENGDCEHADVLEEYPVDDMAGAAGQKGVCDYVLMGKDNKPLAVVEAKRTSKDINSGRRQAQLYAECLERKFGRLPLIFLTNGFETSFWDIVSGTPRKVSGIFSKGDLEKLINRRSERLDLSDIAIDDRITDRYYQKEAIRAVCGQIERGVRKHLLVMATGTGKTRTASSLVDVLSRGKRITNVLFLADRTALVKQAKDDFKNYLPDMSLCNLCSNKDDRNARIVFSTYPTILNAIDDIGSEEGRRLFTPAHFDLIIIDESHRSIFKKYKAIFAYFDAMLVGLTATPKTDVDRNTYDFFEMEHGVPTYVYDYETAVEKDRFLVPYYNYEVKTKFLDDGIHYDELSAEDKERFESDFAEDDGTEGMPDFIPSAALNKFVFNENTVNMVLQDLMGQGIKTAGGDRLGKTIIFAQNKRHAEFILECFNKLYPQYKGLFACRIICDDSYAQTLIDDFKQAEKNPHIAVSVDMLDTGIDVLEVVNLVFFKKVRSKTKFWQMIGRGTRLCKGLSCVDRIDGAYTDKRRFLIFDYCGNFEFFREHKEGYEVRDTKSLSENIFRKQVKIIAALQDSAFAGDSCQAWREELAGDCHGQVLALNGGLIAVKLQLQSVAKYREREAFACLGEGDKGELIANIAPLVSSAASPEQDESAKRFDNFMYGLILAHLEQVPSFKSAQKALCAIARELEKKISIPQVREKLALIKEINTDGFWQANDVLLFEKVRKELRELTKFLDNDSKKTVITDLRDFVVGVQQGNILDTAYDFEDYKAKVNRYVNEHMDNIAIYKLTHNERLTRKNYLELERILTHELGSREDYSRSYGDKPFGLLVRQIAKMDREAAMQAFSQFINDYALNQNQIAFIHKIIDYIVQNGCVENVEVFQNPPFDRPYRFLTLFSDEKMRCALVAAVSRVRENAVQIAV